MIAPEVAAARFFEQANDHSEVGCQLFTGSVRVWAECDEAAFGGLDEVPFMQGFVQIERRFHALQYSEPRHEGLAKASLPGTASPRTAVH